MRKAYGRLLFVTLMIVGLAVPVFGQSSEDEARKYFVRGQAAAEMAKSEEELADAVKEFKKAIEIAPNMAALWYNLGLVQAKMGKLKDAVASYRRYLVLAPKADDARQVNDEIIKLEYRMEKEGNILKKDGRFIAYIDGTVLDTKTKLMWAAKDHGSNFKNEFNQEDAKSYYKNYRGGGYTDWRMPTASELDTLRGMRNIFYTPCGKVSTETGLISLASPSIWSTERIVSHMGKIDGVLNMKCLRALPVRYAK